MAKTTVIDGPAPATAIPVGPAVAAPLTFSRQEFREARKRQMRAREQERAALLRAARAARKTPDGTDVRQGMTARERREYEKSRQRSTALDIGLAVGDRIARVTPEEARQARQHLKTAMEQLAARFKRRKSQAEGKTDGAKARSR